MLPEDFYLATILNEKVETPCVVHEKVLCRAYSYPNVSYFDTTWGTGGVVMAGDKKENLREYFDDQNVSDNFFDVL